MASFYKILMGDISVHNSAGANDDPNTVTSVNANVGRVVDLFMTKEEAEAIQNQVNVNTTNVTEVVENAPVSLNTFKEIADNLNVSDFLSALGDD